MKLLLATLLALLAAPATALAGATLTSREIPLEGGRALAAAAPGRFDMIGVHWRGPGQVLVSTRDPRGRWSGWRSADADPAPGWRLGDLAWVGDATAARFRTRGRVTRLRAYYVESTVERTPARRLQIAGSPPILPRSAWRANERIRRAPPRYADAIRFAVVHHTAATNAYTRAQSAAIVRGIELYHVQGNGWNDIGYNFLVDRYGRIFEGRYGGVDRPVIGAHAKGFNVGSVGVAVIGDYGSRRITAAARRALVHLLAWRFDLAHVDPLSTLTWPSTGNPRFPHGIPVFLRAVSGHRDTNFTDCPGDALYAELPGIARQVALTGAPKLYAPEVAGELGGPVRFTGTLSGETPWTVTVTASDGRVVAERDGVGPTLDWTWDATDAPPDRYTWTISGESLRGATGTLGTLVAFALEDAAAKPAFLAPAAGQASTTIAYTLTKPATVTATLVAPDGTATPIFTAAQPAGPQRFVYAPPAGQAPGSYTVRLDATADSGAAASASVPFAIDTTLSAFSAGPDAISPARGGSAVVSFALAAPAQAQLEVLRGGRVVATPVSAALPAGTQTASWDGTLADGSRAPDGAYTLRLSVADPAGMLVQTAPVTVDSAPPVLTVRSRRQMRFRISEDATVTIVAGSRVYRRKRSAGRFYVWLKKRPFAYRVIATDAAGNSVSRLVRTG